MNSMVDAGLRAALPEAQAFREAMAQVASAAHIVTTLGPHGRAGLTATAVTSVSVAPPTVLVCIEAASRTLAAIEASGIFCVNTLAEADHELASVFSGRRGLAGRSASARATGASSRQARRRWRARSPASTAASPRFIASPLTAS